MKLSEFAVHRQIFTVMVTLIVMILGLIGFLHLPIDLLPDITYPSLSVSTDYENASPEEVEELISRTLEEALSAVPGVKEITSTSSEGDSRLRLSFVWGTDLDAAANDMRDRLDRTIDNLPDDADRPQLRKYDLAQFPILFLGVSSDLDPVQMGELLEDRIAYRLERLPGVAAAELRGERRREIHVNLLADRIKALGLSIDDILDRVREENVNVPAGKIDRGAMEVTLRTPGQYESLDELRDTVIAIRDGAPIQLREIAEVEDTHEKVERIVRVNGKPGVRLSIRKQSGTNTVEVARGVLREVERINRDYPQIEVVPIIDTSEYIQRSISNVGQAALYGGILAIVVLLVFLRNLRGTLIVATAIPISVVATFSLIYFSGYTINIMTLGGLALGVGMLVDNAIVVLENIFRLREEGMDARRAAVEGSQEVAGAIVASTLTTLAVFLPLVFLQGVSGVMFKQLAVVVGFALLCSLVVALSLVPMLAARLFHGEVAARAQRHSLSGLENAYGDLIQSSLRWRWTVVLSAAALFAGSLALTPLIGTELMPKVDESEVRISAEAEIGARVEVTDEMFRHVEQVIEETVPERRAMDSYIGGVSWRTSGGHTAGARISLVPKSRRERSSAEVAADLRRRLSNLPGLDVRTREGQGLFIFRRLFGGEEDVEIEILGHDLEVADVLAGRVAEIAGKVPGVTDTRVSREVGSPEEHIVIDRQKAADMGLSVRQIAETLETVLSGTRAGDYREGGDEYRIRVQIKDAESMSVRDVLDLPLRNAEGDLVVLRNVADTRPAVGSTLIDRKNQERIVQVSCNISGRDMGSVIEDIRERLSEIPVPRDFTIGFGGDYEEQQEAFRELQISFILALVLVYMVMACQFESLRDPFFVMFSVPLAAVGVFIMLLLTDTTFNLQSYIGCLMLGGIVVNNAILLVDHTNLLRRRDGLSVNEAVAEAGRRRLRPILMTALTTMLALTPLALGLREGSEAQAPMARAVIGGLLSSTLITLVVIPAIYSLFEHRNAANHDAPPEAAP